METNVRKKVENLIVDTSAFIQNVNLQDQAENIITVAEVMDEIKSKRQLRRLAVLPYNLSLKEVHSESLKFVTEFSKKTGDYSSLSATDLNVIALTYQLEKEIKGNAHLNSAPLCKPSIESITSIPEDLTNMAGFYFPKKGSFLKSRGNSEEKLSEYESFDVENFENKYDIQADKLEAENNVVLQNLREIEENLQKIKIEKSQVINENLDDDKDKYSKFTEEEEEEEKKRDDDDWITPSNIKKIKFKIADELEKYSENVTVACMTTDFAMQNVLKQIGLHVVSLDGKLIKSLRTFILRCYGCYKTTSIMSKVFCPNCGNRTLKKVAVSVDTNGTQLIHINFRKPLTARGKKYSLPRFKGGKHSNNPTLCEDQPMPQQRASRISRTKNNPFNDDYIVGYSPFAVRDVNSKSAMLGIRPYIEIKHWMRKNPNESRKKKK